MEFNKEKTACFSGYRPHKFDFPLEGYKYNVLIQKLCSEIENAIDWL